jgi:ABC-type transporter Mla maintaining outer membrane lipid asymmetry ATPase subunit MlaF
LAVTCAPIAVGGVKSSGVPFTEASCPVGICVASVGVLAAVVDALTDDLRPRTRVIVAHRMASIRPADRVLFVDGGRVLEDGTIDELLAAGGRFGEFWNQQRAAADWHVAAD